jgi:RimJ/RimL family protein N-acetyltransferase
MLSSKFTFLSPLRKADLQILFEWINDREQVLFNAPYQAISEKDHRDWYESIRRRKDIVLLGIRLRRGKKLIGSCQLHDIHGIHRTAFLQIRIGDVRQRGKGYGTEAVELLLKHAFCDLNLNKVHVFVFAGNTAAIRMYERVGFNKEGCLRKAAHIDGAYTDLYIMGILRNRFLSTLRDANSSDDGFIGASSSTKHR